MSASESVEEAPVPKLSAKDFKAITTLWERYGEAMGNKDGDAAAALYSDDSNCIGIDGTLMKGRQAIAEYYKSQLSSAYANLRLTDVAFDIPQAITKDVAMVNGAWMVHGLKPEAVKVRSTLILRHDRKGWCYVAARFMAALPK